MYVPFNEDEEECFDIRPEYISKFNFTRKPQVVLLKVSDGDKWHFLALKSDEEENSDCMKPTKSFSRLMRDISSKSHENYYSFGCFHSCRCKSTLEKHTQVCKDHDFCKIKLPENNEKIKEHKPGLKALRMNGRIYVDLESFLVGYDTCLNTPIISHTTNIAQHIPSGYAITILRNHNKSTKVTYYRERDCIQKLCEDLRDIANEMLGADKAKIKNLASDEKESHENAEISHNRGNTFNNNKKSKYYKTF